MKFGIRQGFASAAVFVVLLLTLVSIDARVKDRFSDLLAGGTSVSSWSDRASVLGDAVVTAAKHHSIENAPLLIFATVGAVLFLFMVRT
ncbi:MAG TPA: hypothetical protein VNJ03_03450 [Vicinamibacterales bacterium]|nr:hypothetical protein [Vicinamibacterales bacterium]